MMRSFLCILCSSVSFAVCAQQPEHTHAPAYFYLDSVVVEIAKLHFDAAKIVDVDVVKSYDKATKQPSSNIFVKSKDPKDFNFLSIRDITRQHKTDDRLPVIYMLNNEFLKDTAGIKIDSTYILEVVMTKVPSLRTSKITLQTCPSLIF
jgi:hypothetical protein